MAKKPVRVEFLFAGGCDKCAEAREALRDEVQSFDIEWKEVNIAEQPNRAVDLGVVSTPAVAINGELVFRTAPSATELRRAIRERTEKG